MKISILGIIIDTEDIYMITPVVKPAGNSRFDDSGYSGHKESDWQHQFTIKFFNNKSHTIDEWSVPHPNEEDLEKHGNIKWTDYKIMKLNKLRDIIIEEWNANKPVIKKIEF